MDYNSIHNSIFASLVLQTFYQNHSAVLSFIPLFCTSTTVLCDFLQHFLAICCLLILHSSATASSPLRNLTVLISASC